MDTQGEAVSNNEMFRRLAKRMGIDDPWFDLSDDEQLEQSLDWTVPQMEGITLDRLKADGFLRLNRGHCQNNRLRRRGSVPVLEPVLGASECEN